MYIYIKGKTVTFEVVAELRPEWRGSNAAFTPTSRRLRQLTELQEGFKYTVAGQVSIVYFINENGNANITITAENDNIIIEDSRSFKILDYYPETVWFVLHIIWVILGLVYNLTPAFKMLRETFNLPEMNEMLKKGIQILIRTSYLSFILEMVYKDSEWDSFTTYPWEKVLYIYVLTFVYFLLTEILQGESMLDNLPKDPSQLKDEEITLLDFASFNSRSASPWITFMFVLFYLRLLLQPKDAWLNNIASQVGLNAVTWKWLISIAVALILAVIRKIIVLNRLFEKQGWDFISTVLKFLLLQKQLFIDSVMALYTVIGHVIIFIVLGGAVAYNNKIRKEDPNAEIDPLALPLTIVWIWYTLVFVIQSFGTAYIFGMGENEPLRKFRKKFSCFNKEDKLLADVDN